MPRTQQSKRRRAQRRYVARPSREQTAPTPGAPAPTPTPTPRTPPAAVVLHRHQLTHYEHIAGDLKRLGIITGVLLVVLIVLSLVL